MDSPQIAWPRVATTSGRTQTAQRILEAAREVFNEQGVDRATLLAIAARVGISQGNLNYHFCLKKDLINELIRSLEQEVAVVSGSKRDPTPSGMANYLVNLFYVLWRYHFFFASLTYLVRSDKEIEGAYERITAIAQTGSAARIQSAVASRDIPRVIAPNSPKILAENMWAVWIYRLGIGCPSATDKSGAQAIYDCCLHHMSIIQPYSPAGWLDLLHDQVRGILKLPNAPS